MTKKDYIKYHSEHYDTLMNRLYPGDTVVITNIYTSMPVLATVSHFTENLVIMKYKWGIHEVRAQRDPNRVLKIKDKDGNFVQNLDACNS